jgi:metal transporter CNNM
MTEPLTWIGIAACISQSAVLSGLNLAIFSLSRLRLEVAAEGGDALARIVLALRRDANFTLATVLWANVSVNVLLTLLAESVLAGIGAFLFSTVAITFIGEVLPQAYFKRYALPVVSALTPLLRGYQVLFWPVARPTGRLLDAMVGREAVPWFQEQELEQILRHQATRARTELGAVEATGAINFLALDDLPVRDEGEPIDPLSIVPMTFEEGRPAFPPFVRTRTDPFLRRVAASGRKWVILVDEAEQPRLVLNANELLRDALFGGDSFSPLAHCHHPLVVGDGARPMGELLGRLTVRPERPGDDVIDEDLILLWNATERRIVTGSDILGRLLRRIARSTPPDPLGA